MKCSFCGHQFSEETTKTNCEGCPLMVTCGTIKCPNCNYEIPKEPRLIKAIKAWRKSND